MPSLTSEKFNPPLRNFVTDKFKLLYKKDRSLTVCSEDEVKFIEEFRKLSPQQRKQVIKEIKELLINHEFPS